MLKSWSMSTVRAATVIKQSLCVCYLQLAWLIRGTVTLPLSQTGGGQNHTNSLFTLQMWRLRCVQSNKTPPATFNTVTTSTVNLCHLVWKSLLVLQWVRSTGYKRHDITGAFWLCPSLSALLNQPVWQSGSFSVRRTGAEDNQWLEAAWNFKKSAFLHCDE